MDFGFLKPNWKNVVITIVIIAIMFFLSKLLFTCFDCAPTIGIPIPFYTPGGFTGWGNVPESWDFSLLIIQVLVWYVVACLLVAWLWKKK